MYMRMAEAAIDKSLRSVEMESGDVEVIEEQTLEAMEHTTVIGGFCSTCQTMWDNWPDLEIADRDLRDPEVRLAKSKEKSNTTTSPSSQSANLA